MLQKYFFFAAAEGASQCQSVDRFEQIGFALSVQTEKNIHARIELQFCFRDIAEMLEGEGGNSHCAKFSGFPSKGEPLAPARE